MKVGSTSARTAGTSPSCAFGNSAIVGRSHGSNSTWRSRSAFSMVIVRDVGHGDRHVAEGGLMADAELRADLAVTGARRAQASA